MPFALAGCGDYNARLSRSLPGAAMKADIHPDYHDVVFQDVTSDFKFLTRSTLGSKETIKWEDGNEYPLIKVEISSATHPFYTGQNRVVDTAGRIDKFKKRYAAK
jgi:large subunit ribosomal protein L31